MSGLQQVAVGGPEPDQQVCAVATQGCSVTVVTGAAVDVVVGATVVEVVEEDEQTPLTQ